jgi:hypothetical protein
MRFSVTITYDRKSYTYEVEQIEKTNAIEKYKVFAANGSIVLQNNWPVLRARNLKHRRPTWRLIEGQLKYRTFTEQIVSAIEKHIKNTPST